MRYSTIVEKNEATLLEIIEAVEQFEEDRFLATLSVRSHPYDIQQTTQLVREYQAKMNREALALAKFSETFIHQYATDNNRCFETAQLLFNRIRSTVSITRRLFRKTCPIVRRLVDDRPSIFQRSVLSFGACQRDLFGVSAFDESVRVLYEDLQTFFVTVINVLSLCRHMIHTERTVREDDRLCLSIYQECRDRALAGVKSFTDGCAQLSLPETELLKRLQKAKSLTSYAKENYHRFDTSEFEFTRLADALRKGRSSGLTDDETRLWSHNYDHALRVRKVVGCLDRLADAEGQRGKLSGAMLVEFVKWCQVAPEMERNMYNTYFLPTYHGRLQALSWSTVCKVRKERRDMGISDAEECASFEKRLLAVDGEV